jgi:5-methyltetrahydropteroyltriglutamate--homocysteine methyltransferase
MKTSKDRILTTHAGSLPRTDKLAKLLIERDNGLPVDEGEMRREVERTTDWLVAKQLESGVDIASTARPHASGSRPMSASACPAGGAACHHAKA